MLAKGFHQRSSSSRLLIERRDSQKYNNFSGVGSWNGVIVITGKKI
jgi:hypothetical protein